MPIRDWPDYRYQSFYVGDYPNGKLVQEKVKFEDIEANERSHGRTLPWNINTEVSFEQIAMRFGLPMVVAASKLPMIFPDAHQTDNIQQWSVPVVVADANVPHLRNLIS